MTTILSGKGQLIIPKTVRSITGKPGRCSWSKARRPEAVAAVLEHYRGGLDFADARHMVSAEGVFEKRVQKAKARGLRVGAGVCRVSRNKI